MLLDPPYKTFLWKPGPQHFIEIHGKTRENSRSDHKVWLQILRTRAYNYRQVRSSPLHISHGLHFRRLPIAIIDRPDSKNIYATLNNIDRSTISWNALCMGLGLHRLRFVIGEWTQKIYVLWLIILAGLGYRRTLKLGPMRELKVPIVISDVTGGLIAKQLFMRDRPFPLINATCDIVCNELTNDYDKR